MTLDMYPIAFITKPFIPRQKVQNTYYRNWWWMVHEKITKVLPPLRGTKLSKKQKRRKIFFKLYEANRYWDY